MKAAEVSEESSERLMAQVKEIEEITRIIGKSCEINGRQMTATTYA